MYIYFCMYVYIYIYAIMKTMMFPLIYHTNALWQLIKFGKPYTICTSA